MNQPAAPEPGTGPAFDQLLAEVMATADRFGHREHVHLAWLAVRACGVPGAVDLMTAGIRRWVGPDAAPFPWEWELG